MNTEKTEIYPGLHEWEHDPCSEGLGNVLESWVDSCGLQPDNTCEYVGTEECEFQCPWHRAAGTVNSPEEPLPIDFSGITMGWRIIQSLYGILLGQVQGPVGRASVWPGWRWAADNAKFSCNSAPWIKAPEPDYDDIPF